MGALIERTTAEYVNAIGSHRISELDECRRYFAIRAAIVEALLQACILCARSQP